VTDAGETPLRLAMLGMVEGNGHPYSWSAIFNGYDPEAMAALCPFPGIVTYLGREPSGTEGVGARVGAKVTHVWTDDPEDAPKVARAALIPDVAARPEDVIGAVDAVLVATDVGGEHVARCRPFVEAGVPVFVDKPLADSAADLATFRGWVRDGGARLLSSSCMRYAKEFAPFRESTHDLGELRFVTITMAKSWERYGIHALEAVYPVLGPGFVSARALATGTADSGGVIVRLRHRSGADVLVTQSYDLTGSFGVLQIAGTAGHAHAAFSDTYYAFRAQLEAFVGYLKSGVLPFPFAETDELIRMVIAGRVSRDEGGREVLLEEFA